MTRRQRDLVLLLGAIYLEAPFAQPKTSTGELVRTNAERGETPSKRVPCPACHGFKTVRERGFPTPCDRCLNDKGQPLGWIEVDGNINERYQRQLGSSHTGVAVTAIRTVLCSTCGGREFGNGQPCPDCRNSGVIELTVDRWRATHTPAGILDAEPISYGSPILACMEARQKAGSFEELGLALAALHFDYRGIYRETVRIYALLPHLRSVPVGFREILEDPAPHEQKLELGLAYLGNMMPDQIRVPGSVRYRAKVAA